MPIRTLLAETNFAITKTSMVCEAFDAAWNHLRETDTALADPVKESTTRTMIAKRIIEMALHDEMDCKQLRDDAIAHAQKNRFLK